VEIDVALTAASARAEQIRGRVVCVIDVLRASSTIAAALSAGAAGIRPVATVDAALALRDRLRAEGAGAVLAGERGGDPPPGFDLGNSPRQMKPETVGGREVILTTTNGTLAVDRARRMGARRIYVGAFVNLDRVVTALREDPDAAAGILLYAAGSDGRVSLEDTVCAGLMARELSLQVPDLRPRDAARVAIRAYTATAPDWPQPLLQGDHARRLLDKGYGADVDWCLRINAVDAVGVVSGDRIVRL